MSARRRESAEPFVSKSTADITRSLDFVQGRPCVSCPTVLIVGVDHQRVPVDEVHGTTIVGVDPHINRSADCVRTSFGLRLTGTHGFGLRCVDHACRSRQAMSARRRSLRNRSCRSRRLASSAPWTWSKGTRAGRVPRFRSSGSMTTGARGRSPRNDTRRSRRLASSVPWTWSKGTRARRVGRFKPSEIAAHSSL